MCSGLGFFINLAFRASKNRFITIVLVYLSPRAKRAKVQRRRCDEGNTDHTQDILPYGVVIEILAEIIRMTKYRSIGVPSSRNSPREEFPSQPRGSNSCACDWI